MAGLEPARSCLQQILSLSRLPIPTHRLNAVPKNISINQIVLQGFFTRRLRPAFQVFLECVQVPDIEPVPDLKFVSGIQFFDAETLPSAFLHPLPEDHEISERQVKSTTVSDKIEKQE